MVRYLYKVYLSSDKDREQLRVEIEELLRKKYGSALVN